MRRVNHRSIPAYSIDSTHLIFSLMYATMYLYQYFMNGVDHADNTYDRGKKEIDISA